MPFTSWLRTLISSPSRDRRVPIAVRKPAGFRPRLETLERRDVPSTLTVTNNLDSGAGSLRAEIAVARSNDTIVCASNLSGQTINLTSGELDITKNLTIQGPGAGKLIVSGGNASRVFEVDGAKTKVTLSGLDIVLGNGIAGTAYDGSGGGVLNFGTLTLNNCDLSDNSASLRGGGVFNYGTLTVSGSYLSFNYAQAGGGIGNFGTLTVSSSIIGYNEAFVEGGGIGNASSGTATISGCTLGNNQAGGYPGPRPSAAPSTTLAS